MPKQTMQQNANSDTAERKAGSSQWPAVRRISVNDLIEVLGAGLRDFRAAPLYGLFFGGVYAAGGWLILALLRIFDLPFLAYPLAMGFALIAPFVVSGVYDVSRRLELGQPLSWSAVLGSVWAQGGRDLGWMALVTGFTLFIWMDIAAILFFSFFGLRSLSLAEWITIIFTTPSGWLFLLIGNTAGAIIAFGVFSFSVVSFPMLYDRDVDFVTGMVTSVKVVQANTWSMAVWCAIIAALVGLSILSVFVGLIVMLPVLGHATWHLYRRAVEPEAAASQPNAAA